MMRSIGSRTLLVGGLVAALALPAGAQLTSYVPVSGSTRDIGLTFLGGDLTFAGIDKSAQFLDQLYLIGSPNTMPTTGPVPPLSAFLGDNFSPPPPSCALNQFCLLTWSVTLTQGDLAALGINPGSELIFGLYDLNLGNINYTGDPNRNGPPPFFASTATCTPATTGPADQSSFCIVAIEDLTARGDGDVNDLRFSVTATPEPASLSMLAMGMLGLGGAGFSRRKKIA